MGRSVATHSRSIDDIYTTFTPEEGLEQEDWQDFLDNIKYTAQEAVPSLAPINRWDERECRFILANGHFRLCVSEYCGLVAVGIVPRDDVAHPGLAAAGAEKAAKRIRAALEKRFDVYACAGRFSNGEAVYTKINSINN